jgi:hypothetical protein
LRALQEFNANGRVRLVVAGGLVANMVREPEHRWHGPQDIDLFIVANTEAEGVQTTMDVLKWFRTHFVVHGRIVTNNALSVFGTMPLCHVRHQVQLVLRVYPTPGAVLRSFDLSQCCAEWDGYNFMATELFALSVGAGEFCVGDMEQQVDYTVYCLDGYAFWHVIN